MSAETTLRPADARRVVKHGKNKVHSPVVSTGEVADGLGIDTDRAFELLKSDLESTGHLNSKHVGDDEPAHCVWW
jgi:hypothetical protein